MVEELKNPPPGAQGPGQPGRRGQNDRWGDIYTNMPVRKMIALYDYDPQVLSPNVDAEVIILSSKIKTLLILLLNSHHIFLSITNCNK